MGTLKQWRLSSISDSTLRRRQSSSRPRVQLLLRTVPVQPQARYRGRRLLVLYIDLYNMSLFDQLRTYAHADRYIATQMTPADMVQIMVFQNGRLRVKQEFTDDRAALRDVIESLRAATEDDEPTAD